MSVCSIITKAGAIVTSFEATVEEVSDELNRPGGAVIGVPLDNLSASNFTPGLDEVYFAWEHERFWGRGLMVDVDGQKRNMKIHCSDVLEYFDHRYFYEAASNNFGWNMSFETNEDLNGGIWSKFGNVGTINVNRVPNQFSGSYCARIHNSNDNLPGGMQQTATALPTINANLYLSAWMKISTDPADTNGQPGNFPGAVRPVMSLQCFNSAGTQLGTVASSTVFDVNLEWGIWHRVECPPIYLPPATHHITWNLFASGGYVFWDEVRLTLDPKLDWSDVDPVTIVRQLAQYAQGKNIGAAAKPYWPSIKDDLNIATSVTPTSRTRTRRIHLDERASVGAEIRSWADRDDGVDVWVSHSQAQGTRTLHIADRRGVDRSATVKLLAGNQTSAPNCDASYTAQVDGRNLTNADVLLSGSGPSREYGWSNDGRPRFVDTSNLPPDESVTIPDLRYPTLESVRSANQDTPLDGLMSKSRQYRLEHSVPSNLPTLTCAYDQIISTSGTQVQAWEIDCGDILAIEILDGWYTYTGNARIVKKVIDATTRQVTFTPNPTASRGGVKRPDTPAILKDMRQRLFDLERQRVAVPTRVIGTTDSTGRLV